MPKTKQVLSRDDLGGILECNGWLWTMDRELSDEFILYQMTFQTYCRTIVRAYFSKAEIGDEKGDFGICSLDAQSVEDNGPFFERSVIEGILQACDFAEDNLLTIGIPFCKRYYFHSGNIANKNSRNAALRRKFGLDE